jgi:hypothetical protein
MKTIKLLACLFLFCTIFSDCKEDILPTKKNIDIENLPQVYDPYGSTDFAPLQDTMFRPIVMVHGFLASGDTWSPFAQRFSSNGYSWRRLFVFDWNSLGSTTFNKDLDVFIDDVLKKTGYSKVDLMGHSAGAGNCFTYLKDAKAAAKVAHYVLVAGAKQTMSAGPTGEIPTLNIWSDADKTVAGSDIPGAQNVKLIGKDHYEVATSAASFEAIYIFFKGSKPATTKILYEDHPCIAGRACTFGENSPAANAAIEVWETDSKTGERLDPKPFHETTTDAKGYWLPVIVKPNTTYEITVKETGTGKRTIHYYREGLIHNNLFVYLRTIPPPGSFAGLLLGGLPTNKEQVVLNVFSSSQAVVSGRDTLSVEKTPFSTPAIAPASKTMIALFLYDTGNLKTDLTPLPLFGNFTFLNGLDYFIDATLDKPVEVAMNGRKILFHRWPANNHIVVTVFD